MNESLKRDRSRKTTRETNFDINRSPHTGPNLVELNLPKMSQSEQIKDLSATIISGTSRTQKNATALSAEEVQPSTSKQAALANMEDKVKQLVNQSMNSHLDEVKKNMAELTSAVSRITVIVQQTQEGNKMLREKLPRESPSVRSNASSRSSSRSNRDYSRSEHKLHLDKWGLEFNGDNNSLAVEDFVFRVERLQSQYGTPWKEVMDNFHLLVKGAAEKWYWLFIRSNYVTEWVTLKHALLKQYQPTRSSFELMRDMVERRQLPGESIDDFFFAMIQLRSRLSISMPESEVVKMIKKNLRENIGKIVYPMSVSTVEELRVCCIDAEKTFLRKDLRTAQVPVMRYPRQVNELYGEHMSPCPNDETITEEVAEVMMTQPPNQPAKQLVCWNCHKTGHAFMDCPSDQRSIFCYKCGKPDVTSPNCSTCRNRNFQRNEGRAGNHRSSTNPQKEI